MLKINVHQTSNFSAKQLEKYTRAVAWTERVINSKRFKEKFLSKKFTSNKGMTNQQIYNLMMSGAEVLDPIKDNEADVFVTMYYKNNSTVGYTYPSVKETWVNSKFFDQYDEADIGCNLIHEWFHKLGFGHVSSKEHTSLPYASGYLVEECIREMIKDPSLYAESAWGEDGEQTPVSTPDPVPEPEPKKVKVCSWKFKWGFIPWRYCWYE